MDERTWQRWTEIPLLVASLLYLAAYSWRVIADLSGEGRTIANVVIVVTWGLFIADYLVRLTLAKQRRVWVRQNWVALAYALIPVLRLVRLLRVLTFVPGMKVTAGNLLRSQILVYGAGAAVVLIYLSSLAVLEAERRAPGATITDFGVALWWACTSVTTTGYGDYVPVTFLGRAVGVGVMFGGVALAGIITATLASWVLERATRNNPDAEPSSRAQVRTLNEKVEALTAALATVQTSSPPRGGAAPAHDDAPDGGGSSAAPGAGA